MTSRFGEQQPQSRLLRYHWNAETRLFALDPGFPIDIPSGGTEAVTLAKDTTGTLWIAYTLNGQVFVSHSLGDDTQWASPLLLPVAEGTTVGSDDIAGIIALPGSIGVFWSNQRTDTFYFAVHQDGTSAADPAAWRLETVASGPNEADDHFNLKLASDGRLFVALKTSHATVTSTHVGLVVRSPAGEWSPMYMVADRGSSPTRPLCVLDEAARQVYVFYSNSQSAVYYKASSMDDIAFPTGPGTAFIASDGLGEINNPTGTKQNVDLATTGIVVLASGSEHYWHNILGAE
jgi:hypothetical protein